MYAYIEGTIREKNPAYVVIDNQGIGYWVNISLNTYSQIKDLEQVRLFTHFAIKNEATSPVGFMLYGFAEENEREFFRHLISVSGVGNNTAILILSSLTPDKLYKVISENNVSALQSVKGIGAKSAQRIIIDLKDKISKGKIPSEIMETTYNTNREEALSGLAVLGFSKNSAEKVLNKIIEKEGTDLPVEELIKKALKTL